MTRWLATATPGARRQLHLVVLSVAVFLVHGTLYGPWMIEDAAISFAFARNLAEGHGAVANVGGEWVEGFSNPTWTLLLAFTSWLGLPMFTMAKLLGVGAGALTLPLAWMWARRLQPEGDDGIWPALGVLVLALSSQFTMWSASGLENGLFNLFLAAGVVRLMLEGDRSRAPLSAVPLGLLALTRPEAPVYAGVITLVLGPRAFRQGGWRWLGGFLLLSGVPFVAWHLFSWWAFAWELPNTFYAKDPAEKARPLKWGHRSWSYLRSWALVSTHGFLVPLFAFGHTGFAGWRGWVGRVVLAAGIAITVPGIEWVRYVLPFPDEPAGVMPGRITVYGVGFLALVLASWGRHAFRDRAMAGLLVGCTLAFCVLTGGDWMRGFRWLSFATVPLAVLAAEGASSVAGRFLERGWVPARWRERLALLLLAPLLISGIAQTIGNMMRSDTTPFAVRRRALFHQALADRLHVDHVTHMEIDMGGNMYWSGFELTDIAGLVDVPIAHHRYAVPFVDEYVGQEKRPLFVHIHGGWSSKSKVVHRPWFKRQWVEVPGYAHSPTVWHVGTHIRRDAFVSKSWPHADGRKTRFGRWFLEGLHFPAPVVAPGGELFVEIGWSRRRQAPGFRALLVLTGEGRQVVRELPFAYDWLRPAALRVDEIAHGRHSLSLPDDLPVGTYDVSLVMLRAGVKPGLILAEDASSQPVHTRGEMRWRGVIEVKPREEVLERATLELGRGVLDARASSCEEAEHHWSVARRFLARSDAWQSSARPAMERELATCWAKAAEHHDEEAEGLAVRPAASWIQQARRLDLDAPDVGRVSSVLAERWTAEGRAARDRGDADGAWRGLRDALLADPARSWLRREAEELRAERLELEER